MDDSDVETNEQAGRVYRAVWCSRKDQNTASQDTALPWPRIPLSPVLHTGGKMTDEALKLVAKVA